MSSKAALVSIGLPIRNGERTLASVIECVLAQDHERIELIVSDNASTDRTEMLCRKWAAVDRRIVYHRHQRDVGIFANFVHTMNIARGEYFRWIGDDDWIAPDYVSRCLAEFFRDTRLILVTTQIRYTKPDGSTLTRPYSGNALHSNAPIDRFEEIATLLSREDMPVDPLYGLMKLSAVRAIARRNMIREDEIFAAKLALAGPWGHVSETLAHRHLKRASIAHLARRLGVPSWQAYVPLVVQCREILRRIGEQQFSRSEMRRARLAVARLYAGRHYANAARRARKLMRLVSV
jgi:glycosyltransferase involved in cell wall biosynthesis